MDGMKQPYPLTEVFPNYLPTYRPRHVSPITLTSFMNPLGGAARQCIKLLSMQE